MGSRLGERPPHIFALSEAALFNSRFNRQNQALIISGESGAGKTETTKVILQYLTQATANSGDDSKSWIEQKILEANTVLESFGKRVVEKMAYLWGASETKFMVVGNAKTVRNNNSSRFGKFVQVLFNQNHQIIGASIVNYLLEKSRVVRQATSERNYHIFYELVNGASAEEKEKFKLKSSVKDYKYLNQSGCFEINGVNDKKNFGDFKLALTVLKMSKEDLEVTFKTLSAVLLLGNIQFDANAKTDGVSITSSELPTAKQIAELMQIDEQKLVQALCNRKITVRNESTIVPLKKDQVTIDIFLDKY
jgi:myosin-7